MTTVAARVRVWTDEGVLSAQCDVCAVYLEAAETGEAEEARLCFLAAHPDHREEEHSRVLPTGWVRPLSGPGAWSQ